MYYYSRLRDLREDNDKTQQEIAAHLNISQVQYHRYESGKREIPYHMVIELADLYNVSVDYISGRTDEKSVKRTMSLTEDEALIIHRYRALGEKPKGMLLERLEILYSQQGR